MNTDKDGDLITRMISDFSAISTNRGPLETHMEEVARLVLPSHRGTFTWGNTITPGTKRAQEQVDSTAEQALATYVAIVDSLLTPMDTTWHGLTALNPDLLKDRQARLWFEQTTRKLFQYRYASPTGFIGQNQMVYESQGAFGSGVMFVEQYIGPDGEKGIAYRNIPIGEAYFKPNRYNIIDTMYRAFRLTARQCLQLVDGDKEKLPPSIKAKLDKPDSSIPDCPILHCVAPREDYDESRLDSKGMKWASYYISFDGRAILREGGYHTFPYIVSRYSLAPNEVYGRGPAMKVLGAIKTLNLEKRTVLEQGHRAVAPPLLMADDGIAGGFSFKPGAENKGAINSDGKELVKGLMPGNIAIGKELMDDERMVIKDSFLVNLFQILTETPTMSATEVIERTREKAMLMAPTVGRQQPEYLGTLVDRELDVLASFNNLLDPMPQSLREMGGAYKTVYTGPMAMAQRAGEAAGFMRTMETAVQVFSANQDPSIFDHFEMDVALPEIAIINATPSRWMASPESVQAKRQSRAQQQERAQQTQEAPAAAALISAGAKAKQAGVVPQ